MNLSEPFIRRPVATSLIMSALALVGLVAFPFLPIGLTLEEVRDNLVKATSNATKGTIFTPKVGYTISTNDQITQAEALKRHPGVARRRRAAGARCRPGCR
jgi:multidrug efflux pump subunit AcrB